MWALRDEFRLCTHNTIKEPVVCMLGSYGRKADHPAWKPWQRLQRLPRVSMGLLSDQRKAVAHISEGAELDRRPDPSANLVLYSHMLCPYAQSALLTLLCKGVQHQVVQIDLCNKPAWFADVGEAEGLQQELPMVELRGQVRAGSNDVCRWICETNNGRGHQMLKHSKLQDKIHADSLIETCPNFIQAGLSLLAGSDGSDAWQIGTGQTEAQWKAFERELEKFQRAIDGSGGPFLTGSQVSLADLMFMPFMERFAIAMPAFTPYDPCTACDGTMGYWLAEMEQLECCQMAAPDQELFLHALRQWRSLDFFKYVSYGAYQLHPHLR